MESKSTEQRMSQEKPTETPVFYTAVGWVAGTYQPSSDKLYQGVLVTRDDQAIPAELHWRLRNQLKRKHPGYAEQPDFSLSQRGGWFIHPLTP